MDLLLVIHIIEWLAFILLAYSIVYVFIFALISLLPHRPVRQQKEKTHRFLVIFPAYAEDAVIIESVNGMLAQNYPKEKFDVVVVSDHMNSETNRRLEALPVTTLIASYEQSTKAKALQLAIRSMETSYDYVVILDADNRVMEDFLTRLNTYCMDGVVALQTHRTAKNADSEVARLDGASEEINNTIFREAHNKVGLAAALIGSGMCIEYSWFKTHVSGLSTAGEDKELEEALLSEGYMITYLPDLYVWDEKVQNSRNFGRQRRRWIAAQLFTVRRIGRRLPWAVHHHRWNLVDKWVQNTLIPRSICLFLTPLLTLSLSLIYWPWAVKWLIIMLMLVVSLALSLPRRFYSLGMLKAILRIPFLVVRMVMNLTRVKGAENKFDHTTHGDSAYISK